MLWEEVQQELEMSEEDIQQELLKYLKEQGPTNTFSLSSKFEIDRDKLLTIAKNLEKEQAVKFERGNIVFLKFPRKEAAEAKKPVLKPKVGGRLQRERLQILEVQKENKRLREKLQELEASHVRRVEELKEEIKELEQKAATPKIVRKIIIKKVPVKVKKQEKKYEQKKPGAKIKMPKFPKFKIKIPKLKSNLLKKIQRFKIPGV